MSEAQLDPRTVVLKKVRLSFCDSLKDKKKNPTLDDAVPKHSLNTILEAALAESETNRKLVMGAIRAACQKEWGDPEFWKVVQEKDPKRVCYKKGERFTNSEGKVYDGYAGNMAIACGTPGGGQKRPILWDRVKREVPYENIEDVFYAGVYADVQLSFYGTKKGGNGIFCTADLVRSRQEGERIGGGVVIQKNAFDDLDDNAMDGVTTSSGVDDDGIG